MGKNKPPRITDSPSAKWGIGLSLTGIASILGKMGVDAIKERKAKKNEIEKANPEYTRKQVRQSLKYKDMKDGGTVWTRTSRRHG